MIRILKFIIVSVTVALTLPESSSRAALYLTQDELDRSVGFGQDGRFQSVGAMFAEENGEMGFAGSGVLISPTWVLASGHQVTKGVNGSYQYRFGSDYDNALEIRTVTEVVVHPQYNGSGLSTPDLALFRLDVPVTSVSAASRFRGSDPEIPWFNDPNQIEITMAGFGLHGVAYETVARDSLRRGGANLLESYTGGADDINMRVEQNPNWSNRIEIEFEWKGTPGDSGGGWFREVDGEHYLVGITWGGFIVPEHPGWSLASRMSLQNDWIDSVTAVPEPSSATLLLLGISACLCRRRRRTPS